MTARARVVLSLALLTGIAPLLCGCGLAGAINHNARRAAGPPPQANPGEPQGTLPAGAEAEQTPRRPASTPEQAITQFAALYINWTYHALPAHERQLAAIAVGDARLAERQAATTAQRDTTLQQGHIYNQGSVIAVSRVIGGSPGQYAVITREQTGGDEEYAGLQAAFHITLATVAAVRGGWAVEQWQPQS
jgi:hypothetical protein